MGVMILAVKGNKIEWLIFIKSILDGNQPYDCRRTAWVRVYNCSCEEMNISEESCEGCKVDFDTLYARTYGAEGVCDED